MTKIMDVQEAQNHFDEFIKLIESGTEVLLTNDQLPFARVVPAVNPPLPKERVPGLHRGAFVINDDFNAPLPDDFWLGEE